MSKQSKAKRGKSKRATSNTTDRALRQDYNRARKLAQEGRHKLAREIYERIEKTVTEPSLKALINNDLATLLALGGENGSARERLQKALSLDEHCEAARANLAVLEEESSEREPQSLQEGQSDDPVESSENDTIRVAILSFLFNWPSTGGGNVHTYELASFLGQAGYDVRHFYVRHAPWGIGSVEGQLPYASECLEFDESMWNAADIQARFRQSVDAFRPDHVIISDSWNFKPLLAEAMQGYPYILRLQALECLCPLNNVRLLPEAGGGFRQCALHQLATPQECASCLRQRGQSSGRLHQAERALSRAGTPEYYELLRRALRDAEAVLVVNPLSEAMISPYAKSVRVVTAGMDPGRFPWPSPNGKPAAAPAKTILFFAGLVEEWMKGYDVLHQACEQLWQRRQDFELVATGDPPGPVDEFTRFVGWLSQEELPGQLREAGMLIMPTIAQEALGRTAVEAMAAGRPVIASRLGGLQFTVADGATGLLCEPGNVEELAQKIETLLDDPELREQMGRAGRRRFEEHYAWPVIIERHYQPLLGCPVRSRGIDNRDGTRAATNQLQSDPIKRLAKAYPWPREKPKVPVPREHLGWLADGARELLLRELSLETKLVVELGTWLGLSTRFLADHAPQAIVVTIDHFQGSQQHRDKPEWRALLPTLYEAFVALSWSYRERIIALKMTTREGLKTVAAHELTPDLIYIDAEHKYESVSAELELAHQLFPETLVVGDDYSDPNVREAVTDFAHRHGFEVEAVGRNWQAWKLVKRITKARKGENTKPEPVAVLQ